MSYSDVFPVQSEWLCVMEARAASLPVGVIHPSHATAALYCDRIFTTVLKQFSTD